MCEEVAATEGFETGAATEAGGTAGKISFTGSSGEDFFLVYVKKSENLEGFLGTVDKVKKTDINQ